MYYTIRVVDRCVVSCSCPTNNSLICKHMFLVCRIMELPYTRRLSHASTADQTAVIEGTVPATSTPQDAVDSLNLTLDLKDRANKTAQRLADLLKNAVKNLHSLEEYESFKNDATRIANMMEKYFPHQGPSRQR